MEAKAKIASVGSKQRLSHPTFHLTDINKSEDWLEKGTEGDYPVATRSIPHGELLPIYKNLNLCGIVLAGGEGMRLQSLIHRLRGDALPKQFVNFIGTRSMLEHTFLRAEKLIPSNRIFTAANWAHLRYPEARRQISSRPRGSVIVQPGNKDTGPGVLLPLMHLSKRYPESTVVVFPSDHFIFEEDLFMNHVYAAYRAVEQDPSRLVLLGIKPDAPELEYGYMLPGERLKSMASMGVSTISHFIEKPKRDVAEGLILRGGLWNTMVMVFRASALLDLLRRHFPATYRTFQRIKEAIGSPFEKGVVHESYSGMEPVNFSRDLLEIFARRHRSRFLVLPVRGVFWSDWGSEHRVMDTLKKIRCPQARFTRGPGAVPEREHLLPGRTAKSEGQNGNLNYMER